MALALNPEMMMTNTARKTAELFQFPRHETAYEAGMREGANIAAMGYAFNEAYAMGVVECLNSSQPHAWLEGFREAFRLELDKQDMGA